ncbi:MAG TPA: hypothetical protein V6D17_24235 [Candidatus Obscuribacterales bacterium]
MSAGDHNVSGTWLGNYYYSNISQATGFEAVFVQSGAAVEGSILDDGALGEAHLTGSFGGGELTFCKIYNSKARDPVYYRGTLSEDGKSMWGTWRINKECHGMWKAWRLDDEELPEQLETDEEVKQEKELLAPLTSPSKSR